MGAVGEQMFAVVHLLDADRLEALSPGQTIAVLDLLIGELTGDAFDDAVIVGADSMMKTGFAVVPMHVQLPAPAIASDPTCAP